MAGTYSTDLVALFAQSSTGETSGGGVNALGHTTYQGYGDGSSTGNSRRYGDPDLYIVGTNGITCEAEATATPPRQSSIGMTPTGSTDGTSPVNTVGHVMSLYGFFPSPVGTQDFGNTGGGGGGTQVLIGQNAAGATGATPYRGYRVDGKDTLIVGGWQQYFVDPQNAATGATNGTYNASAAPTSAGIAFNTFVDLRRDPIAGVDGIRWGRHLFSITGGTLTSVSQTLASTAANFIQAEDYDQYNAGATPTNGSAVDGGYHRFGQVQPVGAGYSLRGVISIGTTATAVNFDDRNSIFQIPDLFLTYDDFNRIELRNTSSNITFVNATFNFVARNDLIPAGDAPATPLGNFEVFNNPTVALQGCSFNDMGTFIFQSNTALTDTTIRRCGQATQNGATITNSTFEATTSAASLIVSAANAATDIAKITGTTFNGDGSNHAIEFDAVINDGGSDVTLTWSGNSLRDNDGVITYTTGTTGTFSNTGADANAAIALVYNGSNTVFIDVVNGADIPSIENTGSGNVTVRSSIQVNITGLLGNTEVSILESPSPYSQTLAEQQAGSGPVSLFNTDFVSAVTGTDIEVDTQGTANVTQIISSTTDFTNMTGLVAGDVIRVTERVSGQNLRTFDTFEVVSVAANVIDVVNVASSTLLQQDIIDTTGDTITVEKVDATYTFSVGDGEQIDILLFRVGSLPILFLEQIIDADNATFPVTQSLDRNFEV